MPYLTPQVIPTETTCRPLIIPHDTEWLGIISGALTELLKLHNWEQSDGGITREAAVLRAWAIVNTYWLSSCEGGGVLRRIYRIGINGQIQFSDDIGETWGDAEGAITEPLPARTEPTEHDKKCAAAANAENVLRQTYLELLGAFNTDSSIQYGIAVFAAILGLLIAAFWLPVAVITALINFALGAFGAAWAGLQFLSADDWTVEFQDDFICLLYNNSTVTNGVVTFDYMAVRDNLQEMSGEVALKFWVFYILQVIGSDGLNAAGATTAISEYNCGGCDEPWCHKIDFTLSDGGWAVKTAGRGTWVVGEGWKSSNISGGHYLHISRDFMPTVRITRIDSDVSYVYGSHSMGNLIRLWLNGEQTGTLPPSWGVCAQATHRLTVGDIGHSATCDRIDLNGVCYNQRGGCSDQGAAVGLTVHSITIYGLGYNPFGTDNCEA